MRTSLINPALWLLALTLVSACVGATRRQSASESLRRVFAWATLTPVLAALVALALAGLGSRVILGYLAPGAYAEDVVGARAFLAQRQIYGGGDRAELAKWLTEEPPVATPWTLPGITPCQASALEQRPQFFTSQGHMPSLLLASVPYAEVGVDRARAELKSRFLSQFAADVIRAQHPKLAPKMQVRTAVLDWRSRALETIAAE